MPELNMPTVEFTRVQDPLQYDMGQWALTVLGGLLVGTLAGVGLILGWARHAKDQLDERITDEHQEIFKRFDQIQADHDRRYDKIEHAIHDIWKALNQQAVDMASITNTQLWGKSSMEELKEQNKEQTRKIDLLLQGQKRNH